jgi:hypothetical protein
LLGRAIRMVERIDRGIEVGWRGTVSDNTRTDPPPKHKNNNEAQPDETPRELLARRETSRGASARLGKSTSGCQTLVRGVGRAAHAERWLEAIAPEVLPPGAARIVNHDWSKWYRVKLEQSLQIILEVECWSGELWAHLSVTGRSATPTLAELGWCRDVFLGSRKAIQIFPSQRDTAAAGARSLHLYAPLESDTLPSFRPREPIAAEAR